ncbi:amidohydrolase [Sphingomicrobium nitratireducens]|uniref:amidohydrolase n=1 Tax=Sphingomicrobium nitratireducens TaxID=2964666 RepID=UPI00223F8D0C|nr:amidohydrolase [Sphingomicrobium nitratireducens]
MRLSLLAATASLALCAPAAADTLYADLDGLQAKADGTLVRFSALLVDDAGKVVRTYSAADTLPSADLRIDMGGAHVLPGLIDGHGHLMGLGQTAMSLQLYGTDSIASLQKQLAEFAAANHDAKWIVGRGWNHEMFADGRFPSAADLDAVVADRPVLLERVDGHAVVANSLAMRMAKIVDDTPDPTGGAILRDDKGKATGMFVDTAGNALYALVPAATGADLEKALGLAQDFMLSQGLTAMADMGTSDTDWHALRRLGDEGGLKVRVMSYAAGVDNLEKIAGNGPTPWLYDGKLRMAGVKLVTDGALGSRGAWLKANYADADTRGLQMLSDDQLRGAIDRAVALGHQVATHAIGDAANDQLLDAIEETEGASNLRFRDEHTQILDPDDLPRLAASGVIASMQPVHQASDWKMAEKRLGMDRLGGAYAWRSLKESGALLAFGSDFPVEHPNPFAGLEVSVTRTDANGEPEGGWRTAEAITLGEALAAFTHGAAFAGRAEDRMGGLEPGRYADFIVVDRDIAEVDPSDISETKVLVTYVSGKEAYRAAD